MKEALVKKALAKQSGSIYVWMVLLLPVFLMLLGLISDLGTMYVVSNAVQVALDQAGTSAVSSSIIEESLQDEYGQVEIDPNQAEDTFYRLLQRNLRLDNNLYPLHDSLIDGSVSIGNLDIRPSGPPTLNVTASVPVRTNIFRYLRNQVTITVNSESQIYQEE